MKHSKTFLGVLAALVIVALVVRQISQAVKHTFAPPAGLAQVAPATPPAQNGLTLLEVDPVSPDRNYSFTEKGGPQDNGGSSTYSATDTGLWIKMPPNFTVPNNCSQSNYNGCDKVLTVTGRTSTGHTFPLSWQSSSTTNPEGSQTYLLASIPAGYPNSIRWVDVTLDDKRGDKATWRITHLPPMQHLIAPPVTPQTTFHQGSIQAVASAYSGPGPYNPTPTWGIHYDMKGTIKGAAHQWELGHLTETLEWEPPGYVPQDSGSTMGTGKVGSTVNIEMSGQELFYNRSFPYLADTHWVRLSAKLQEFETYDETVTFHNVSVVKTKNGSQYVAGSGPQTITTPSGVNVTLDDVQHRQNLNNEWGGGGYSVHLLYPQTTRFPSLPRSPLWQKYKRPITVNAYTPKQYEAGGSSFGNNEGTYHFRTNWHLPTTVIPNFPMIICQRVDLRSVPMTFTLPVRAKRPTQGL